MFQKKVVEKIKTYIPCSIIFPPPRKSCHFLDIVEKHARARQATDENMRRRKRFACWLTKATDMHSEYVIRVLIAYTRQKWLRKRASILRSYAHRLSC